MFLSELKKWHLAITHQLTSRQSTTGLTGGLMGSTDGVSPRMVTLRDGVSSIRMNQELFYNHWRLKSSRKLHARILSRGMRNINRLGLTGSGGGTTLTCVSAVNKQRPAPVSDRTDARVTLAEFMASKAANCPPNPALMGMDIDIFHGNPCAPLHSEKEMRGMK